MGKAIKCSSCGLYYNMSVYSECPHCKQASGTDMKRKSGGSFLIWKNKSKTVEKEDTKIEVDSQNEDCLINKEDIIEMQKSEVSMNEVYASPDLMSNNQFEGFDMDKYSSVYSVSDDEEKRFIEAKGAEGDNKSVQPTIGVIPRSSTYISDRDNSKEDDSETLLMGIAKRGKTIGKYISNNGAETAPHVVGWLVCVKGEYFGQAFSLKSGKNKIGRSHEMDVKLLNDESVSRNCVAIIIFDAKNKEFSVMPGESDGLCYVNGNGVYGRVMLNGNEEIELGDSEKNKFVFIPLCGERFNWDDYQQE